jgi:hypothetical protein
VNTEVSVRTGLCHPDERAHAGSNPVVGQRAGASVRRERSAR